MLLYLCASTWNVLITSIFASKLFLTITRCKTFIYSLHMVIYLWHTTHVIAKSNHIFNKDISPRDSWDAKRGFSLSVEQVKTWQVPYPFTLTLQEPSVSGAHWPRNQHTKISGMWFTTHCSLPANNVSDHKNIGNGFIKAAFPNLIWFVLLVLKWENTIISFFKKRPDDFILKYYHLVEIYWDSPSQ